MNQYDNFSKSNTLPISIQIHKILRCSLKSPLTFGEAKVSHQNA